MSTQVDLFACSQSGVRHFPAITSIIRVAGSPPPRSPCSSKRFAITVLGRRAAAGRRRDSCSGRGEAGPHWPSRAIRDQSLGVKERLFSRDANIPVIGATNANVAAAYFRPPDIAPCKNVRFRFGSRRWGAGRCSAAVDRRTGEGEADARRGADSEADAKARAREDRRRLIEELAQCLRGARSMWRAQGSQRDANVMCSSLSEARTSPAAANSSCRSVRPSCSARA
jgi:hypothetical protein